MKILAISIKNLASLEGITEIDFRAEPLNSAGIFAITGATGAGKSTILDGLCLALYGKTPRYLQAKEIGVDIVDVQGSTLSQGDVRAILRDGTAEGYAAVDFVGIDGMHYCATWSVRRARNKVDGSMQSDQMSLRNLSTNSDIAGKKQETLNEIARLVGLNFEQFTRSVLLAQGDFTAFMKANKDEKSSLLEKLTGTHIYSEISKKIFEKSRYEEQQLSLLTVKIEGIGLLSKEEQSVLEQERAHLDTQIITVTKEVEVVGAEIAWHQQLSELQKKMVQANETLLVATKAKDENRDRAQRFLLVEQAQQSRSWVDAYVYTLGQFAEKKAQLEASTLIIGGLEEQKEKLGLALIEAAKNQKQKNNALTELLPVLEQAKQLDTLLLEKKKQLEKLYLESERAEQRKSEQVRLLGEKHVELSNYELQIKTIKEWKRLHTNRSLIAENVELILSKFKDAEKLLQLGNSIQMELALLKQTIEGSESELSQSKQQLEVDSKIWEDRKKSYELKNKELLLQPIEAINLERLEVDSAVEMILKAAGVWQQYFSEQQAFNVLNKKQLSDQEEYQSKKQQLESLSQELAVFAAQKDSAEQLFQKAQIAATENVESLRMNLVDGEACPVCGSCTHPYSIQHPNLDNVLAVVEQAFRQSQGQFMECYRRHNAEEKAIEIINLRIQSQKEELQSRQAELEKAKRLWEQFDISKECCLVEQDEIAQWIENKMQQLKSKQAQLLETIERNVQEKQQLEASKIDIDRLKESIDKEGEKLHATQAALGLCKEQQRVKTEAAQQALMDLGEMEKFLTAYFPNAGWNENWRASPLTFVEEIERFAIKWKENEVNLKKYELQSTALGAGIQELENQLQSLNAEAQEKEKIYNNEKEDFEKQLQQRAALLEGKAAAAVEESMRKAIEQAQSDFEKVREAEQQNLTNYTKAKTQIEEIQVAVHALGLEKDNALKKVEKWLALYNQKNGQKLLLSELQEILLLSNGWVEAERSTLKLVDEELLSAHSVFNERKQSLEAHQSKALSSRGLEELSGILDMVKKQLETYSHKKSEIRFQLTQDEENKKKLEALLKSVDQQRLIAEKWSKLNEIIGSADGKKFRQIAQEYTLDVLLGYANIHLKALTSRYRIERIAFSLGLQVVDQDMGDEVRTVYSLSGGESFLLSLSLALGLASLSSSKMKVESLFIDEGFGSLDPETLNVAMDALERLHNQGRKVGVISHVQEMTERIPVQIRVSKQQSGKSQVAVLSQ